MEISHVEKGILIDTDIMIHCIRGRQDALKYLKDIRGALYTSVMSIAELYAGVREGIEREGLDTFIAQFTVLPVTSEIAAL